MSNLKKKLAKQNLGTNINNTATQFVQQINCKEVERERKREEDQEKEKDGGGNWRKERL